MPLVLPILALLSADATAAAPPLDAPTWAGEVAAIVYEKCSGCHQPGQGGPFDLLSFEDALEHGETMAAVIEADYMPPWPPSQSPALQHDRRLSPEQERTVLAWVAAGMPAGDLETAPQPTIYEDGWRLGTPDLVVEMDRAYEVRADGRDIYRWFALPVNLPEDRYISAIEYRPTARGAVHHVLFYYDPSGRAVEREQAIPSSEPPGFRGMRLTPEQMLGGYVPGTVPQKYPEGIALHLPAGSDLVLQTHFHPSGRVEQERARIGLHFAETKPERPLLPIQMPPRFGAGAGIDIPPGEADWRLEDEFTLPTAVRAIGVSGHAHYVCSQMEMLAHLPDGTQRTLLAIDDWDLDWQGDYLFEQPVDLPAGTRLAVTLRYDNSAANPDNPFSPPRRITWGEQSTDEMGSMTLDVVTDSAGDDTQLMRSLKRHVVLRALPRRQMKRRLAELAPMSVPERIWFAAMDKSRDGKLQRDEVPQKYLELHAILDVDADGGVSRDELDALRAYVKKTRDE